MQNKTRRVREEGGYSRSVFQSPSHSGIATRAIFFPFVRMLRNIEEAGTQARWLLLILIGLPGLIVLLLCVTPLDPILVFSHAGYERPSIVYGYDSTGKSVPIAEFYKFSRRVIDLSEGDGQEAKVVKSFLATEDNNFYMHPGVDPQGILRAALVNAMAGRIREGASTITQQVARLRFLSNERSMFRKIREAFLALLLEVRYSKKDILEMYLNEVPLGHGTLGVEAAADFYFGKSHTDLSWGESALLASLTTRPRDFSPLTNPNESRKKVRVVLRKLVETGTISISEAEAEYKALEDNFYSTLNRSPNDTAFNRRMNLFPYVTEYVKKTIPDELQDELYSGGLQIQTTIVVEHQKAAEDTMQPWLARLTEQRKRRPFKNFFAFDDEVGSFLPLIHAVQDAFSTPAPEYLVKRARLPFEFEREFIPAMRLELSLLNMLAGEENLAAAIDRNIQVTAVEEDQKVEGALISIRPDTGAITAVLGGSGFVSQNQQLRFLTSRRQPGSSFKPIVYAAGIEETGLNPGTEKPLTAATVLDDSPVQFLSADLSEYSPDNYTENYEGPIRLRKALQLSKNAVAVRVYERLGASRINPVAEKILGFDVAKPARKLPREATVALGTVEMTPFEMARTYCVFASGGYEVRPYLIESIKDVHGKVLYDGAGEQRGRGKRVLSAGTAQIVTSMMQDVVRKGTGTGAALPGREVAGKTGTTNRNTDAWFIGFTGQLVTAIQIGYDSGRTLGSGGTGGSLAAPVWGQYMNRALMKEAGKRFEFPESNVQVVEICDETGMLPSAGCSSTIPEYFLPGTAPKTEGKEFRAGDPERGEAKRKREDIFSEKDF
ncbi:MAG: PBP1A family penicillin-binding protein [Leptospirales bacterium]|nr:PBP1A family penicillin-binding protein [Leptospirales bacterium]